VSEIEDAARDAVERSPDSKLNAWIGVMVAVSATMMALGNIKDGNIGQAMSQAQVQAVDAWSYYQAKSTKEHLAENSLQELRLRLETEPRLDPAARAKLEEAAKSYEKQVAKYETEKTTIEKEARAHEQDYDRLNMFDDQFDLAEACFTISIALYGITVLTRSRWLMGFAMIMTMAGAALTFASFMGWKLHPDALTKFFS
jgi:coenzyme F420-reducing hydrogenase alpha subunit